MPSGNRVALEPVVALVFELDEAPGDAALGELVPMSLHAPRAAAAASAIVAIAIFSKCIGVCHRLSPTRRPNPWGRARVPEFMPHRSKLEPRPEADAAATLSFDAGLPRGDPGC
jgi:hypothetical protein